MESLSDLIVAFGGPTEFGKACGYPENPAARGSDIKRRGSIPPERWGMLVAVAEERGIKGVTADFLMRIHSRATSLSPDPTPQETVGVA